MIRLHHLTAKTALAALLAATMLSTGAYAGEQTRAEEAISVAKGKIDAGDKAGAGDQAPELQAQARQELVSAEDLLSHHNKKEAIAKAQHASELADQAIVSANTRKSEAERVRRDDLRDAAATAQQSAANANVRADNAQQATTMANMRADSAEQSSAAANAQADALRNMPAPVPAPSTTTVVTDREVVAAPAVERTHHIRHRVTHRHARVVHAMTTTTTVTTNHP